MRFERNASDRALVVGLGFFVCDVQRNVSRYLQLDFTNLPTSLPMATASSRRSCARIARRAAFRRAANGASRGATWDRGRLCL